MQGGGEKRRLVPATEWHFERHDASARILRTDSLERRLFLEHVRNVLVLALRESKGGELTAPIACASVSKVAQHQLFLRM